MMVTGLAAQVRLPVADHAPVAWNARVERVGDAIDPATQSAPVVVRVDDPLSQSVAGQRPPLRRNMVVKVELSAPRLTALVVPAEAIPAGVALVVSPEGTLERRAVETAFVSSDLAVVTRGLSAGDKLVITDPGIAVPGMVVKPVEDEARKAALVAVALGRTPADTRKPDGAGKARP